MMSDTESRPTSAPSHPNTSPARRRRSRGGRGRGRSRRAPPPSPSTEAAVPVTPHARISAEGPVETSIEANAETPLEPVAPENSSSEEESFFAPSPEVEVPDQPAERGEERKALAATHASTQKPAPSPLAQPKHPA